ALNEARINDGLLPRYSDEEVHLFANGTRPYLYPDVNWFDQVYRGYGTKSVFNLSLDGGKEGIVRYYVYLGYAHKIDIFQPVNLDVRYPTEGKYGQFTMRTNVDVNLTSSLLLKLDVNASMFDRKQPRGTQDNLFNAIYSVPSAAFPVT